jgi:hypothetical protein
MVAKGRTVYAIDNPLKRGIFVRNRFSDGFGAESSLQAEMD